MSFCPRRRPGFARREEDTLPRARSDTATPRMATCPCSRCHVILQELRDAACKLAQEKQSGRAQRQSIEDEAQRFKGQARWLRRDCRWPIALLEAASGPTFGGVRRRSWRSSRDPTTSRCGRLPQSPSAARSPARTRTETAGPPAPLPARPPPPAPHTTQMLAAQDQLLDAQRQAAAARAQVDAVLCAREAAAVAGQADASDLRCQLAARTQARVRAL